MENTFLTLPVVHLVDTEGPLHEPLDVTFSQINRIMGTNIKASLDNLEKIQQGIGVSDHLKEDIQKRFSKHRLDYNDSWEKIDKMCQIIFSSEFRALHCDDFDRPYQINWCCLDHLGFTSNPRFRELGPNKIFQYFEKKIESMKTTQDRLYWHYHPISFGRQANTNGTNLSFLPYHYTSLAHRILDCFHFPSSFRPGFHMERVDLNVFLEQWIPFDFGNQNSEDRSSRRNTNRFDNWDGAPLDWGVYHPSFSDARRKGNLKRSIARCLNIGTDFCRIDEKEIDKAFKQVAEGRPGILSYTDHDHRNMAVEIEEVSSMLREVSGRYPQIKYKFCTPVEAMRLYYNMEREDPVNFEIEFKENRLDVYCSKNVFGAQPFLAIRTKDGETLHDNFCLGRDDKHFFYAFDGHSIKIEKVEKIGVAANDSTGNSTISHIIPSENFKVLNRYILD